MLSKIKHWVIVFISIIICFVGVLADVVFITALFNNMRIFEDNKLWVSAPVGEWGLAIIISLVGLFIMFSAGRKWAVSYSNKTRILPCLLVCLWMAIGITLVVARVTLAADSGLNQGLILEAVILLLLFIVAGVSMFSVSQSFVNQREKNDAQKKNITEEITKCLEECTLIENEQNMFISQTRQLNLLKRNSIDLIIAKAIINNFRTKKGIIVSEEEIPFKYMS